MLDIQSSSLYLLQTDIKDVFEVVLSANSQMPSSDKMLFLHIYISVCKNSIHL